MPEFNMIHLEKIMRDFYTATHLRICLLDRSLHELASCPGERSQFCAYIRKDPEMDEKCRQCDKNAFQQCKDMQGPLIYPCHAGLTEVIIPVRDHEEILCYLMFGQIISSPDAEAQRERIRQRFSDTAMDREVLNQAIANIRCRSVEQINACATIATCLVLFISNKQMIKPDKKRFIELLNGYIDENMSRTIKISDLCDAFYMSRSQLYNMARPYLSCSLSRYIINYKIRRAEGLLTGTELTISEVSQRVGFDDVNYFRRVFRQKTGCSAKEYRALAQNRTVSYSGEEEASAEALSGRAARPRKKLPEAE